MKFQIDVPDLAVADLSNQSEELQAFLLDLRKLCIFLTDTFRKPNGERIFSCYLRNSPDTVFLTDDKEVGNIEWELTEEEAKNYHPPTVEELDNDPNYDPHAVWMKRDRPDGDWIVLRFCCTGLRGFFRELYASDFGNGQAEEAFDEALQVILKVCRPLPKFTSVLSRAIIALHS